jgi:hypothetical protein
LVLKDQLKSDEIQITVDMPGAPKICGEVATKAHRKKPFITMRGRLASAQSMSYLAMQLLC